MRRSKYTAELLAPIVAESQTMVMVLNRLGLRPTGGNYRNLSARIRALGLDTSHFTGSAWSRGLTAADHPTLRAYSQAYRLPDEVVFVANCPYTIHGRKLTKRLRRMGWEYRCANCGLTDWLDRPLTLHLDHINGINNDHRLENLRFLCPNCHQQTDTWGNHGNRRRGSAGG